MTSRQENNISGPDPRLSGVLKKIEACLPDFLPAYSPQQLELLKKPTPSEKRLVTQIIEDCQRLLNGQKQEGKEEAGYRDLVFYITQFTQFQREKQKEEGKEENFFLHQEQVLALIRAVDHYQKGKRVILEMKTGEGKSQIVIPIFLAWLGKREESIHVHEVNPFLLDQAYKKFLDFAGYLGIEDQVGKLTLDKLKETKGKKFLFGLWHDFIHWYQFSFLKKADKFPLNPLLVLDEIDQLLMDEALTPAIISDNQRTSEFLGEFLELLKQDLEKLERLPFEFEFQGIKITIDLKEFDDILSSQENFIEGIQKTFDFEPLKQYLNQLEKEPLSEEKKIERLMDHLSYLIFGNIIFGKIKELKPDFEVDDEKEKEIFQEKIRKTYKEKNPVFWFDDPEVNQSLISALLMKEGYDYIIKDNRFIPLAPTSGYQEKGKNFPPLTEIFLHIKHHLPLANSLNLESDRLSTFEFYQRFNRIYGFTGTASTVAKRLLEGYGLDTTLIPPYYQDNRDQSFLFFNDRQKKLEAVESVFNDQEDKRNTLVVFSDFDEAQNLFNRLKDNPRFEIKILSAENEEEDFNLYHWISSSSNDGKRKVLITVKMIGRGVDLRPDGGVRKHGFLLLVTSPFEYQRSHLQLLGRVGRRGERGEIKNFISSDDPVFNLLPEKKRKQLSTFFEKEDEGGIRKMIAEAWQKKEDKITERFSDQKSLFWPIVNLREYVEIKEKIFPQIKKEWIKKGVPRGLKEFDENYVLLPNIIEEKFKEFLLANWIEIANYLEDNLKALALAGPAGPLSQLSPRAAAEEVYEKSLSLFFEKFIDNYFSELKKIKEIQAHLPGYIIFVSRDGRVRVNSDKS